MVYVFHTLRVTSSFISNNFHITRLKEGQRVSLPLFPFRFKVNKSSITLLWQIEIVYVCLFVPTIMWPSFDSTSGSNLLLVLCHRETQYKSFYTWLIAALTYKFVLTDYMCSDRKTKVRYLLIKNKDLVEYIPFNDYCLILVCDLFTFILFVYRFLYILCRL